MKAIVAVFGLAVLAATPQPASAWGDDGHKTVALIAQHYLTPAVKAKIDAMLAADTDNLAPHDIASAATWADKYRDSNNRRDHYEQTKEWHFADMEILNADIGTACFGRLPLPAGTLASSGPPKACVVDKAKQFADELGAPGTDPKERLFALKFLLHFAGDIHQPLHSSDNNDRGGNEVKVSADGIKHQPKDELHGYWDTQFVDGIGGESPTALAKQLLAQIAPEQATLWAAGSFDEWAMEAYMISKNDVYGSPPLSKATPQHLDAAYVARAEKDVAQQLSKAGVRLASVLNKALGSN
jgi:S1/P1 Nuclease